VTFLFTDIEGSTRRWEDDPDAMRAALVRHDQVLRWVIDGHGGWLFKHTGDGVCAAFGSARAAIEAAVAAQRRLELPVRMGVATGEAELRGDDYFGPVLNRTARVMAAGHGGQILVAASTAAIVTGVDLFDRGEHRLRDLSGVEHLFQVHAEGLAVEFAPLRTVDAVPGNLPIQTTSFIGRDVAVKELCEQVRAHRLVTLTGVGGVGKTRLAVQVAAELVSEFPEGVWLVELAPVGDPGALADVVATVLGVTPQAGLSMTASLIQALSGRRLLVVLDNCEHLLDAAAALVEELLTHTADVRMLTTSREVLRVSAEQVWSVPSLEFRDGIESAAVALFVERAQAVDPSFGLGDEADAAAVPEICRRLDGIPLAIELAAARIVVMSAQDVRDHLGDRFRLLSGSRRGLERHQTLRQAVAWSYDLLNDDERTALQRCSVFAGGFDLAAATAICEHEDQYAVLDLLESLARKSLLTVERVGGHARYGMLETIRQFAEEQLAATDTIDEIRDRHAQYFAYQAVAHWDLWDGPQQRIALDWLESEFANLRAGFRWATDHADLVTATAIAAHTAAAAYSVQQLEPVGWAEEILAAATAADVAQLPRLYTAASLCVVRGRPQEAVRYAQTAVALESDDRYDPFETGLSALWEAIACGYAGDLERRLEICTSLSAESGLARVLGLCALLFQLPALGRVADALFIAEEAVSGARAHGNPEWIAFALEGYGRALASTEPVRALTILREALEYTRSHRLSIMEATIARDVAGLEAAHGDLAQGLMLFDTAIDSLHRAGNVGEVAVTLESLVVFIDRDGQAEIAATIYGATTRYPHGNWVIGLPAAVEHLRAVLGETVFDECVATGATMEIGDAVAYAREQIQEALRQIGHVA
jgi:predicted ATPase